MKMLKLKQSTSKGDTIIVTRSKDRIVIDTGSEEGVSIGDRFLIYAKDVQIRHYLTNKVVGVRDDVKAIGVVTELAPREAVVKILRPCNQTLGTYSKAALFRGRTNRGRRGVVLNFMRPRGSYRYDSSVYKPVLCIKGVPSRIPAVGDSARPIKEGEFQYI